jgi:GT2 family glycosyltransferase
MHNNPDLTQQAVLELFRTSSEVESAEIIVVNDHSTVDVSSVRDFLYRLQDLFGTAVIYHELEVGLSGYGVANHRGVELSAGRYISFINTDAVVTVGWLASILSTFDTFPLAAAVGPLFVGDDGIVQESGGTLANFGEPGNYGRFHRPSADFLYARVTDYVSGACLVMLRSVYDAVGGFDPRFGRGYFEDTDLAMSIKQLGLQVVVQPTAIVYHQEGHTLGGDDSPLKQRLMHENGQIFYDKWKHELSTYNVRASLPYNLAVQHYRQRLLWVDDIVPEPDSDSGSIRTLYLISMLVQSGIHVTYQPSAPRDPHYVVLSQYYGVRVLSPLPPSAWILQQDGHCMYDVIVIARRYVFARSLAVVQAQCPDVPIIYDTVDLHFLRESRDYLSRSGQADLSAAAVMQWLKNVPAAAQEVAQRRDEELSYVDVSAATLVVSTAEIEVIHSYKPDAHVVLVSNVHEIQPTSSQCKPRRGLLFVGNFNHVPNNQAIAWLLEHVMPGLLRTEPEHRLHIVGANNQANVRDMLDKLPLSLKQAVIFHGHLSNAELAKLYNEVRIAVAPLQSGAGVKGKVNQAMAKGVPVVATSIAAEGMQLVPGRDCIVADSPEAFLDAISSLCSNCTMWDSLREQGLQNIQAHFSPEVAFARFASVLNFIGM